MSENQRNRIFADFLKRNIRPPTNILDVACGDGRLGIILSELFPLASVTGIDLKPRGRRRNLKMIRGSFPDRIEITSYDLIAGMHPDGATWPIVEACCLHQITFAVVPCCLLHVPPHFPGGNMYEWAQYIASYTEKYMERVVHTTLKMRGANQVILGIAK